MKKVITPLFLLASCAATTAFGMESNNGTDAGKLSPTTDPTVRVLEQPGFDIKQFSSTHPRHLQVTSGLEKCSLTEKEKAQFKVAFLDAIESIDTINIHRPYDNLGITIDIGTLKDHPIFKQAESALQPSTWQKKLFYPATAAALLAGVSIGYLLAKKGTNQ